MDVQSEASVLEVRTPNTDDQPQTPQCSKKFKTKPKMIQHDDTEEAGGEIVLKKSTLDNDVAKNLFKFVQEEDFSPIRHLKSNYLVNRYEDDNPVVFDKEEDFVVPLGSLRSRLSQEENVDPGGGAESVDFKQILDQFDLELQNCSVASMDQSVETSGFGGKEPLSPSLIDSQQDCFHDITTNQAFHDRLLQSTTTTSGQPVQSTPLPQKLRTSSNLPRVNLAKEFLEDLSDSELDLLMCDIHPASITIRLKRPYPSFTGLLTSEQILSLINVNLQKR